jgi:hypothetical protein
MRLWRVSDPVERRSFRLLLGLALAPLPAMAACGGGDERRAVEEVARSYLIALRDGDGETACGQLTRSERASVARRASRAVVGPGALDCEGAVVAYRRVMRTVVGREPRLASVSVEGDTGYATAVSAETRRPFRRYRIVRAGPGWRIDAQLPP